MRMAFSMHRPVIHPWLWVCGACLVYFWCDVFFNSPDVPQQFVKIKGVAFLGICCLVAYFYYRIVRTHNLLMTRSEQFTVLASEELGFDISQYIEVYFAPKWACFVAAMVRGMSLGLVYQTDIICFSFKALHEPRDKLIFSLLSKSRDSDALLTLMAGHEFGHAMTNSIFHRHLSDNYEELYADIVGFWFACKFYGKDAALKAVRDTRRSVFNNLRDSYIPCMLASRVLDWDAYANATSIKQLYAMADTDSPMIMDVWRQFASNGVQAHSLHKMSDDELVKLDNLFKTVFAF